MFERERERERERTEGVREERKRDREERESERERENKSNSRAALQKMEAWDMRGPERRRETVETQRTQLRASYRTRHPQHPPADLTPDPWISCSNPHVRTNHWPDLISSDLQVDRVIRTSD